MKYFPNSFIFLRYGTFLCLQITTKRVSQFILLLNHPTRFGNDTKWQGAMWIRICNMTFRIGNMQIINWSDSPLTFYSLYLSFNRHSFSKLFYTILYLLSTLRCTHYHLCFFLLSKAKNRTKLSYQFQSLKPCMLHRGIFYIRKGCTLSVYDWHYSTTQSAQEDTSLKGCLFDETLILFAKPNPLDVESRAHFIWPSSLLWNPGFQIKQ